jgi:HD-like signal output (HDOD) protein
MAPTNHAGISDSQAAFERLCKLPSFNASAVRALSISLESDSAASDLERVFTSDPALAAELLSMANSAEFGFRSRISTIRHAITILGIGRTQALAITIATAGYVRTRLPQEYVQPIWAHGIATAVCAEHLAARAGNSATLLYTAGLTHDLGRLGLIASARESYSPVMSMEFQDLEEAAEIERRLVGVTHTEAGEFLTRSWGFPPILSSCARHHHDLDGVGECHEIELVRAACTRAGSMGYPEIRLRTPAERAIGSGTGWDRLLRETVEQRIRWGA